MVPDGWMKREIGENITFSGGAQPPRDHFISEPKEGHIRLIQIRDYKSNKYATYIPRELARKFCSADDVMIGRYGPPIFQILRGIEGAYNVALIKAIPKPGVDKDFMFYFLKREPLLRFIESFQQRTSGQTGIEMDMLKAYPMPLPPLLEQKKIAQTLSTWDQAITATERLLDNSQQRKKGLMQQLLTGKKRLPGFEGEWYQHPLAEVAKVIVSPVDKKSYPGEQPVHLCNYTDVYYNTRINKRMSFMEATAKDSEIEKYTLNLGDVVITKDSETPGDIAVPALIAEDLDGVVCGYHLAILRPKPSKLNGSFLNYLLSMPKTRYYFFSLATGATRFGLSVGAIHNAELTLPPVPEQEAIAELLKVSDDELEVISQRLDRLKQEKKALMQQLLTGKRRVNVDTEAA